MREPAEPSTGPTYNPWLAVLQLVTVGTLWGATFSIAKLAITNGVPPLGYGFWQSTGSGLVLLAILALRRERLPMSRRHLLFYLMTGGLGISVPNVTFYIVIQFVPVGIMAVVITTAPIITFVLALLFGLEAWRWRRIGGLMLGLAGALLLVLPAVAAGDALSFWMILGFVTPLAYSLNSILTARLRPAGGSALSYACGMMLCAGMLQGPVMLATGQAWAPGLPLGLPELAIALQIAISASAYVVFFHLVRVAGPVYFSQVGYVVTLTGLLWGFFLFHERLEATVYLATVVIFAGLALVNATGRRRSTA
jgi:drug/metabolite transporter (DMT)-like permease